MKKIEKKKDGKGGGEDEHILILPVSLVRHICKCFFKLYLKNIF